MNGTLPANELSLLEQDLLRRYHARYKEIGFPDVTDIRVTSRETSTAGRYVYLEHGGRIDIADGQLGLGTYSQFDAPELKAGASFSLWIESGMVRYLDIAVNGECPWNGQETVWRVCDPDTTQLPNHDKRPE